MAGLYSVGTNPYCIAVDLGQELLYLNPLHGVADVVPVHTHRRLHGSGLPREDLSTLADRGYLITRDAAQHLLRQMWELDNSLPVFPHYVVVLTYKCNLRCPYCYQVSRKGRHGAISRQQCEAIIDFVAQRGPGLLSLYGGEPLLPENEMLVTWLVQHALAVGCDLAVTTNGWWLEHFASSLPANRTRWILVTVHAGQPGRVTERVFRGIAAVLALGHRVEVKTVFGVRSAHRIVFLVSALRSAGLLDAVSVSFGSLVGTALGSLHREDAFFSTGNKILVGLGLDPCFPGRESLEMLFRTGLLRPRFRRCGAGRGLFIFDPYGDVYTCWYSTGFEELAVGKYFPRRNFSPDALSAWSSSVLDFPECLGCRFALLCGSGCRFEEFLEYKKVGVHGVCGRFAEGMKVWAPVYCRKMLAGEVQG